MHKVSAGKVWEYMKKGKCFQIDGNLYTSCHDEESDTWKLCIKCVKFKESSFVYKDIDEEDSFVYMVVDMDISYFDKMCQKISIEEYFLNGCETVLQKY